MGGSDPGEDGGKKPSKWGKGKTDPDSWWKKGGASPNPSGRPKGSKNQKTIYQEAFEAKVVANIDGVEKTMTKKELGYHQLAQKSAAGDIKAFLIQKELDEKFDPAETAPPTPEETAADYHTFKAYVELLETFKVFSKEQEEETAQQASASDPSDDEEEEEQNSGDSHVDDEEDDDDNA